MLIDTSVPLELQIARIVAERRRFAESVIPQLRHDLLATGCRPEDLDEKVAIHREWFEENLQQLIAMIRQAYIAGPQLRPLSQTRH